MNSYNQIMDIRNTFEKALKESSRTVDENSLDILNTLLDKAYEQKNSKQIIVLEDLIYCASHIQMGVYFKARAALPSVEDVAVAFPPDNN